MANYAIDSVTFGNNNYSFTTPYGTCSTAAATAAKVVSCANFLSLETGAKVTVKFTYANSVTNPSLNVNSTGAKTIRYRDSNLDTANEYWKAADTITFVYDGSYWVIDGHLDTNSTYNLSSFGISATSTELNYCDGVTSNIQTQLNAKADSSSVPTKTSDLENDSGFLAKKIPSKTATKIRKNFGMFKPITWSGDLTEFNGEYVWSDGENIYYSGSSTSTYILNKSTKQWKIHDVGVTETIYGNQVWSDGTNTYYSYGSTQYVFNKTTKKWESKTWSGLAGFNGEHIWMDSDNIFVSAGTAQTTHYALDKSVSTWSTTLDGTTIPTGGYGKYVWSDGNELYFSQGTNHNIFVIEDTINDNRTGMNTKRWEGASALDPIDMWTDGVNIFHTSTNGVTTLSFVLDIGRSEWLSHKWNVDYLQGRHMWSDGKNIYYSNGSTQYILNQTNTIAPMATKGDVAALRQDLTNLVGNIALEKIPLAQKTWTDLQNNVSLKQLFGGEAAGSGNITLPDTKRLHEYKMIFVLGANDQNNGAEWFMFYGWQLRKFYDNTTFNSFKLCSSYDYGHWELTRTSLNSIILTVQAENMKIFEIWGVE